MCPVCVCVCVHYHRLFFFLEMCHLSTTGTDTHTEEQPENGETKKDMELIVQRQTLECVCVYGNKDKET